MSLASALLAPLLALAPLLGVDADEAGDAADVAGSVSSPTEDETAAATGEEGTPVLQGWPLGFVTTDFGPQSAFQVRIERRMTIRISPRRTMAPDMLASLPQHAIGRQYQERKIGRCLPVSSIMGVQTNGGSSLILFLRDRRMISAELERACQARDFYSGFYLANGSDGNLCVGRDTLQSRSGANCKLSRMRQLVSVED